MAKTLKATSSQVRAARLIDQRAERGRGSASTAVLAIAKATPPKVPGPASPAP